MTLCIRATLVATLLLAVASVGSAQEQQVVPRAELSRAAQVVEAVIVGTHAYQIQLARKGPAGDPRCWAAPIADADLERLVAHQAGLFASNRLALRDWIAGNDAMAFDPTRDLYPLLAAPLPLDPRLPVNVFTTHVAKRTEVPATEVRSVASLYQLLLEVERDGDVLQDALAFLIGAGFPVYGGQIGLSEATVVDESLATELADAGCAAPFATDAGAWRIAGRKVWNWGEKHLGIRNAATVATELDAVPAVRTTLARLTQAMPTRVAVIGHSFTIGNHWASPGSFTTIAAALLERAHAPIQTRHYSAGGLRATRAWRRFGREALDWRPDVALLVVAVRDDDDVSALGSMIGALREAGARVLMFDELGDPTERDESMRARRLDKARAAGARIVPIANRLASAPDRAAFLSLDGIHMTEPYHRLVATAWLEALADTLVAGK
jgi:hypothetical protein